MTKKILLAPLAAILIVVVLIALNSGPSRSQHAHGLHGDGHSVMHHWYKTLKQPGTGMSCCNDEDCRPTETRVVGDAVEVVIDGEWAAVPPEKIVKTPSPDLGSHVCAPKQKVSRSKPHIFCVIIGSGV